MVSAASYVWELCQAALEEQPGHVAVIKTYLDESGVHDGSPVVTVAAYSARPRVWRAFVTQWNVAKAPISVFHAVDCANLRGEFRGWTVEDRDRMVARLMAVIDRFEMYGNAIGINQRDFDEATGGRVKPGDLFGSSYEACFQAVLQNIIWQMESHGNREALAFIHEDNDYQRQALDVFDYVKKGRANHASMMTLTFASKARAVPLQAADVLAYEANKRCRDQSRPKRRALMALDPSDKKVHIGCLDKDNMGELKERMRTDLNALRVFGRADPH